MDDTARLDAYLFYRHERAPEEAPRPRRHRRSIGDRVLRSLKRLRARIRK